MAPAHFSCDSCEQAISSTNPRIHCLACEDYDLCANCAIAERFTHGHVSTHRTRIFKISGGGAQASVASQVEIMYGPETRVENPARPTSAASPFSQVSPPLPALPSKVQTPPPLPKRASLPPPLPARQRSTVSTLPSAATVTTLASVASTGHIAPELNGEWGPFFLDDMNPTPLFSALLNAIFSYLDSASTGYLSPEAYSRFLDDEGYIGTENTWKSNLTPMYGQTKEDVADKALRRAFDLFSVEYVLQPRLRNPDGPDDPVTRQLQALAKQIGVQQALPPSVSGGMMPLLTRAGFMAITSVEVLCDPSREWGCYARVLKAYNLPEFRGFPMDLPRSVLPDLPDVRMKLRVSQATEVGRSQAHRDLAASRVAAELKAQGEQNAIDLISSPRVRYTYY